MAAKAARKRLAWGVKLRHPDAIADLIDKIQGKANFADGTKPLTVHEPIR